MTWEVLASREDASVNFIRPAGDGGFFEARFVCRSDDYAIIYLSSQSGCRLACRFCHLTQSRQTMFTQATLWDLMSQAMRVMQHIDETGLRVPRLHVNFMARGEPLANPHLKTDFAAFARRLMQEGERRGMDLRFNISTIFPTGEDVDLVRSFGGFPVTFYWSLWSLDPRFRKSWLPKSEDPKLSLARLLAWQEKTGRETVLHWALIAGENDRPQDLEAMRDFLAGSGLQARFNLVRYNSWSEKTGCEAPEPRLEAFLAELAPRLASPGSRIVPRVGRDVKASCGMFVFP